MNGVISDYTAHIYLAQDPSVTTSSGAFCGEYTTYSTSVLSFRDDPIHLAGVHYCLNGLP